MQAPVLNERGRREKKDGATGREREREREREMHQSRELQPAKREEEEGMRQDILSLTS